MTALLLQTQSDLCVSLSVSVLVTIVSSTKTHKQTEYRDPVCGMDSAGATKQVRYPCMHAVTVT